MICKLCGKEHSDPYVVKIQKRLDTLGRDKANIAEIDTCLDCALEMLERAHEYQRKEFQHVNRD